MSIITKPNRLIPLLAGLQAFGPLSIDMYLPALPAIAQDLNTTEAATQQSVSSFLLGLFIGMLFYGPLSDKYGRQKLLIGGIVLYVVASIFCLLVDTAQELLVWRFVQAIGGAAASVLGRAIVRDIFPIQEAPRVLSLMHFVTMFATLLAPLLAGYILLIGPWRWLFAGLIIYSSILLCFTVLKIPETHQGISRNSSLSNVFLAYIKIMSEIKALGYILCMSICFAGMFAYITVSSFVFIDYFGLSPQQYTWVFSLNIAGVMALVIINAKLVGKVGTQKMLYYFAILFALSGLLLIFSAITGKGGMWLIIIGLLGYVSCTGVLGANCIACLMRTFPENAGAATSLAIATQFGLGALLSIMISNLYDGTAFYMSLLVGLCGLASFFALLLTRESA
ncbi:MAG: multidrug effflux MFS transporter [Gammaproteobacteria bacterium]|jgi:MFS transporter, DHA1 family, multidrug resistance protein|nr:multidrug effflux MFS transporter [Gammaproteobacteria bacterium]